MKNHLEQEVDQRPADRGSAMIMVLAFTVIAALIVVPMLNYAMTVLRVNSVSVEKREQLESVRGGARVAIADPVLLFQTCTSQSSYVTLPTPSVESTTQCRQISEIGVTDELTIPYSSVALQVGEQISTQPFSGLSQLEPPAAAAEDWWASTPFDSEPVASSIWLPNLPDRESHVQSSDGHALPGSYNCRVFFPGTYTDPIVLAEPAYFASGNYYFEKSVVIVGGARVVAGFGLAEGCASDLEAFNDIDESDAPQLFNIDGLGATFVFGDVGRLIVDDSKTLDAGDNLVDNTSNLAAMFRINQRYVQTEADGGARVSVMTVNGDTEPVDLLDPEGPSYVQDLQVPGQIFVPESEVQIPQGDTSITEFASDRGLIPSTHTAEPTVPVAPTITDAIPLGMPDTHDGHRHGAVHVKWAAPVGADSGGSTITKYEVFDSSSNLVCETDGALQCVVIDLVRTEYNVTHAFTVVATNDVGVSLPSDPVTVLVTTAADNIVAPLDPTNVVVDQVDGSTTSTPQSAWITWDAPVDPSSGHSPYVASYEVRAYRMHEEPLTGIQFYEDAGLTCETERFRDQEAPTECIIENLPPLDTTPDAGPEIALGVHGTWQGYVFRVTATGPVRSLHADPSPPLVSPESADSNVINDFVGNGTAAPLAPPVIPVAPPKVPDPVVDIKLTNSPDSQVRFAGYTAIPQGRLHITNPNGNNVKLNGGIVAGSYDIDPTTFGSATIVGFQNTVLQRTVQVVTSLPGSNRSSTMTLQINANGADVAVNSWVTQ